MSCRPQAVVGWVGDGARRRLWGLLSLEPGLLWLRCRPLWASGMESDLTVTAPGVWPRGGTRGKLVNLSGPSVLPVEASFPPRFRLGIKDGTLECLACWWHFVNGDHGRGRSLRGLGWAPGLSCSVFLPVRGWDLTS